jgi:hypothetical protein
MSAALACLNKEVNESFCSEQMELLKPINLSDAESDNDSVVTLVPIRHKTYSKKNIHRKSESNSIVSRASTLQDQEYLNPIAFMNYEYTGKEGELPVNKEGQAIGTDFDCQFIALLNELHPPQEELPGFMKATFHHSKGESMFVNCSIIGRRLIVENSKNVFHLFNCSLMLYQLFFWIVAQV